MPERCGPAHRRSWVRFLAEEPLFLIFYVPTWRSGSDVARRVVGPGFDSGRRDSFLCLGALGKANFVSRNIGLN